MGVVCYPDVPAAQMKLYYDGLLKNFTLYPFIANVRIVIGFITPLSWKYDTSNKISESYEVYCEKAQWKEMIQFQKTFPFITSYIAKTLTKAKK